MCRVFLFYDVVWCLTLVWHCVMSGLMACFRVFSMKKLWDGCHKRAVSYHFGMPNSSLCRLKRTQQTSSLHLVFFQRARPPADQT